MSIIDSNARWEDEDKAMQQILDDLSERDDSHLDFTDSDAAEAAHQEAERRQQIAEAAHQGIDAWLADELEDQWLDAYMEDVLSGGGLDI